MFSTILSDVEHHLLACIVTYRRRDHNCLREAGSRPTDRSRRILYLDLCRLRSLTYHKCSAFRLHIHLYLHQSRPSHKYLHEMYNSHIPRLRLSRTFTCSVITGQLPPSRAETSRSIGRVLAQVLTGQCVAQDLCDKRKIAIATLPPHHIIMIYRYVSQWGAVYLV